MRTRTKWILASVAGAIAICVYIALQIPVQIISNLKYEYETIEVVNGLRKYIETHDGEWPKAWADLEMARNMSEFTTVNFNLTSSQILQNTQLLYSAVLPKTGMYLTYPHAKSDLDRVLEMIREKHA